MKLSRHLYTLPNNEKLDSNFISIFNSFDKNCKDLKFDIQIYRSIDFFIILIDTESELVNNTLVNRFNEVLSKKDSTSSQQILSPLERIFKKPPKKDNLYFLQDQFKRYVFTLQLKNENLLIAEYKEVHKLKNIPAQVLTNMSTIGVLDMELYLNKNQAFLLMDLPINFDMDIDGEIWINLPGEREWQEKVSKFQQVHPEEGITEKWKEMNKIIDCS